MRQRSQSKGFANATGIKKFRTHPQLFLAAMVKNLFEQSPVDSIL